MDLTISKPERRSKHFQVCLTPSELETMHQIANDNGITTAELFRQIVQQINRQLLTKGE